MTSPLQINYKGTQTHKTEYGWPVEAIDKAICIVPYEIHQGNVDIALGVVRNDPRLTDAAEVVVSFNTDDSIIYGGDIVVDVTRTRMTSARRQDNFQFEYKGSMTGKQTVVDKDGDLISITYPDPGGVTQVKTMDIEVPTYDITCVGIRDLTPIGGPARLQSLWIGGVNSGVFDGFEEANIGAGGLICVQCNCQPHYVRGDKKVYRVQFRFVGSVDGWDRYIYWKDPVTGEPPDQNIPITWAKLIELYRKFDFQTAWPFGEDVGT
jgi:hypothetical protein